MSGRHPPGMGRLLVLGCITWGTSIATVVFAVARRDWWAFPVAVTASINAAGWWIAVRQWAFWRTLAWDTLAAAGAVLRHSDPPED